MTRFLDFLGLCGMAIIAAFAYVCLIGVVRGEDNHHAPEHQQLHEKFYASWSRPRFPPPHAPISCCDKKDCYPTAAKFEGGKWFALHRETSTFIEIPVEDIERERDNPDGQAHLCANPAGYVYCFSFGAGI